MNILAAKMYIPQLRANAVPRTRLVDSLESAITGRNRLILVTAPAGFGKTTLVAGWLATTEHPAGWVSLDERDNDPVQFMRYLVAALQTISPLVGEGLQSLLDAPQPPPLDTMIPSLLNDIAAIQRSFLLVLDDYHVIENGNISAALQYLIDYLPPQMHLVIITREDPPLSLPRLRARGELTEMRVDDLRFSQPEADAFLNGSMALDLTADAVTRLEDRTEGWIAGLQMAAISMTGLSDKETFVKSFTGSHRFILDYLVEEVLQRQSESVRNFLFQTAFLDQLTAPLCDAVTRRDDSQDILEQLERSNMLIMPLDNDRQWYRHHHLFADVLRAYLMREQSDTVPSLHRRASTWYEQNDSTPEAIRHALLAEDYERAAELIEMAWPALLNGHRPVTWRGWVQALPAALVRTRPVLNMGCAWTLLDDGELEAADAYLRIAERTLAAAAEDPTHQPETPVEEMVIVNKTAYQTLPASIASARAYLAQAQGDSHTARQNAQRALDLFPEDEHYQRGIAALFLGLAYWAEGSLTAAGDAIADCLADMRMVRNVSFQIVGTATAILANLKAEQGHLQEAARIYAHSLQVAAEQGELILQETADQYIGLSALHREWNKLEEAAQLLQKGQKDLAQHSILPGSVSRWHAAMARLKLADGSLNDALDHLHTAQRLYRRDPIPDVRPVAALKAKLWLAKGKVGEAQAWARREGLAADDDLGYLSEYHYMTLARILIAQYREERAEAAMTQATGLLERLRQAAEAGGRGRSLVEILVLQALAYQAQGETEVAVAALQRALSLAESEGYVRVFIDEGQPMRELLAACLTQVADPKYTIRLMQAMNTVPDEASAPPDPNELLLEPLSDRELEVLALLAVGLTNQAIADELVIALSTVKKHTNNMFGKLGVSNRTQAVHRARDLNLL